MDVLILAGGRCRPGLAKAAGCEWRCDLTRGSRTFLEITMDAVRPLGAPILVGPTSAPGSVWVNPGESFAASVRAGLDRVVDEYVLVVTADMPWITKEAVEGFLQRTRPEDELTYPIIWAQDCSARFPGLERTSVRLKEGRFTGGNVALLQSDALRRCLPLMEHAYSRRKNPLALARMIGLDAAARLTIGTLVPSTLTLDWLESRVGKMLKAKVKAQICPFPELGADIDDEAQYVIMQELEKSAQ